MLSEILSLFYSPTAMTYQNASVELLCVELAGRYAVGYHECEVSPKFVSGTCGSSSLILTAHVPTCV
jgi:hypothetical protein